MLMPNLGPDAFAAYMGGELVFSETTMWLVHLDMLLEMPGIEAIQWVPGAGNPSASGWLEYLKRVQAAGKGLYLSASGPEEVELLMRTGVATSELADELVAKVAKWTMDRK